MNSGSGGDLDCLYDGEPRKVDYILNIHDYPLASCNIKKESSHK
jgi:hypothetical protein